MPHVEVSVSEACLDIMRRLRELPAERFSELQEHLDTCAECRAMAERLREASEAPASPDAVGPLRPLPLRQSGRSSPDQNSVVRLLVVLLGIAVLLGLTAPKLLDAYRAANYGAPELPGGIDPAEAWGTAGPPTSPVVSFSLQQVQLGGKETAPALVPPRTTLYAAVTCAEPATVTVCVEGPQGSERLWTGRIDLGRRDVPDEGYRVEKTGRYTFGVTLGEACAASARSTWVDVPP